MNLDTIGLTAGILTTAAWLPQLTRTWRTRSADGLSWPYLAILTSGIVLWVTYGILTANAPLVIANSVTVTLVTAIVAIKATSKRRANLESEPPWERWRLGLFDSNPGGVGLLGSIEGCFELGRWDVIAVAVEAVLVEPVHPRQGGELELVDAVPAVGVGPVDALGLVEPVGRLGQRVVVGIGDGADRGPRSDLVEAFGEPHGCELRSRIGMGHESDEPPAAA